MNVSKRELSAPGVKPHLCPVCGKASYSQAGIHPQCCQARADAAVREKLKAKEARKVAAAALRAR